jgi:phosphatidylserine/phosphatidylglycerophosphate/cardiolipin synthase-like enzyme
VSLREVATRDLERLLRDVRRGAMPVPLSRAGLVAAQLGHLAGRVATLDGLDARALGAVIEAVLEERKIGGGVKVTLVWTGPEGKSGWAEPTGPVVRGLFARARTSVLVAGYSFDHGAEILEPLHAAMKERGVTADLYAHVERAPKGACDLGAWVGSQMATFLAKNWPFGLPRPALYYDPRTLSPTSVESLHAKCIVVDEQVALLGSANFTDRGQSRNVEVGAVIEDEAFARALASQWRSAVAAGAFVAWGG